MNRVGLDADNIHNCETVIRKCNEFLNLMGIFTHLCVADSREEKNIEFTN